MSWVVVDAEIDLASAVWVSQRLLEQRQEFAEVDSVSGVVELAEHVLLQRRSDGAEHGDTVRVLVEWHSDDLIISAPRFAL